MTQPSPTQCRILKAASKQPKADVREHMRDVKSPAIRDNVIESMLKHGLIIEDPDAAGVVYVISDAGFAAIGKEARQTPIAGKAKAKPKREGVSMQQMMIDLLSRKEGATSQQLQEATGWQKHSVRGAMSNMQKKLSLTISATKNGSGERVYKIA
jgi:hypothetical protein